MKDKTIEDLKNICEKDSSILIKIAASRELKDRIEEKYK